MTDAPSPPPLARRYLSLALPFLPTDRIFRMARGKSWRSAAPRELADGFDPLPLKGGGWEGVTAGGWEGVTAAKPTGLTASCPPPPLVVVAKVKSALRLVALDETATRLGLVRGQPLADARAMIPALEAVDSDETADAALLEAIADWAERYTPLVALDPPHGLMLDITGAAHLFGGEAALVADLGHRLRAQGFHRPRRHRRHARRRLRRRPLRRTAGHPAGRCGSRCLNPCPLPPFASIARPSPPSIASA